MKKLCVVCGVAIDKSQRGRAAKTCSPEHALVRKKQWGKANYKVNGERQREYTKRWRLNNPERIKQYRNPEYNRQATRKYRAKNLELCREKCRQWRRDNLEYSRQECRDRQQKHAAIVRAVLDGSYKKEIMAATVAAILPTTKSTKETTRVTR